MILTPLQKLPNNVGNLGKIIAAAGFECLPKVQKSLNLVTLTNSNEQRCINADTLICDTSSVPT